MNEVRIRAAIPADAQAIARVHVEAWRESYRALMPVHVIEALSVDIEWLREHTRLEELAARWDAGGKHMVAA